MSWGSLSQFSSNFEQPMPTMATLSRMASGFIAAGAYDPGSVAARAAGHAGATGHGVVRVDPAHDEDLLRVVHLVPDRLQHLAEERCVGKLPVHELAHVAEAHVAAPQLGAREDAPTTLAHGVVPLEGEVDLIDAVSLRGGAEGRLRARRAAAEENAVLAPHARSFPGTFSPIARTWSNGCATR